MSWLVSNWYQPKTPLTYLFYPLHIILLLLVKSRKYFYNKGLLTSYKADVPVIIVGNITAGGTGKSPLVVHLARQMSEQGYRVGILSRGYGGKSASYPLEVEKQSSSLVVGDEPLMIKQRVDAVVVVDPVRSRGAICLVENHNCDLIICDDGLQHYALQRDIEILVMDGERKFGNSLLMPFGPLREPASRVQEVDALVINNPVSIELEKSPKQFSMTYENSRFISLIDDDKIIEIADFISGFTNDNKQINVVAAIGNPQHFFKHLMALGINANNHEFDDHQQLLEDDFIDMKGLIIMTEKDAVKCRSFATDSMWYLKVDAEISPSISQYCIDLIKQKSRAKL